MLKAFTICGNNPTLLATRRLVLEYAGLPSETFLGAAGLPTEIEGPIVLCHTLSSVEQEDVIRIVRKGRPQAPILLVGDNVASRENDFIFQVSAFAGTDKFLNVVRRLADVSLAVTNV